MITVITSNQPRHLKLINELSAIDDVRAIIEVPSKPVHLKKEQGFSPVMQRYFSHMKTAEKYFFPDFFTMKNVEVIPIPMYTINELSPYAIPKDGRVIVFGASWIKEDVYKAIQGRAINLHAGISPEFQGASCNFWALWHERPDLVGVTVQSLSEDLDNGVPFFYSFADSQHIVNPFMYSMSAINNVINDLCTWIETGLTPKKTITQKRVQLHFAKKEEFTDQIAGMFLEKYGL